MVASLQMNKPITILGIPKVSGSNRTLVFGGPGTSASRSFTPLKLLGDGAFNSVWLCDWHGTLPLRDPPLYAQPSGVVRPEWLGKKLVAVKRMKRIWVDGWEQAKNERGIQTMLLLPAHPNIIGLYDAFLDPESKSLYTVMERMEGNLYHLFKARKCRPMAGGLISTIAYQIASALEHIHSHHLMHRDLKPENILITTTGLFEYTPFPGTPDSPKERDVVAIVKLADFGLTRRIDSPGPYTEYVSTRYYRAPEIALLGRKYTAAVDIWALGTVIAETINLRPLFPGTDQIDHINRIISVLGDPVRSYGVDSAGNLRGGGPWSDSEVLANSIGFTFPETVPRQLSSLFPPTTPDSLIDLMRELLRYDPNARLTSAACLGHKYFYETLPELPLPENH